MAARVPGMPARKTPQRKPRPPRRPGALVRFARRGARGAVARWPGGRHSGGEKGPEPLRAGVAPALAHTLKGARPFARRARSTARAQRMRMGTRNPWVRYLRMTEG